MSKFGVAAAIALMIATPALAAEYYVAQDPTTKKCKIVEEKPDGKSLIMIGTASYPTKDEAKAAKKASAECKKPKAEENKS
jgi:hypothetical protein